MQNSRRINQESSSLQTKGVMDREEYNKKAQELLEDGGTYKIIKSDPTNRIKNKLINLLKKIKTEGRHQ